MERPRLEIQSSSWSVNLAAWQDPILPEADTLTTTRGREAVTNLRALKLKYSQQQTVWRVRNNGCPALLVANNETPVMVRTNEHRSGW
jgi:hypothetical protein